MGVYNPHGHNGEVIYRDAFQYLMIWDTDEQSYLAIKNGENIPLRSKSELLLYCLAQGITLPDRFTNG